MHILATLALDSTGYRLLLLGHLLCVIVGFGSTFVYPFLGIEASKRRGAIGAAMTETANHIGHIVTSPFILASGVFGALLVAVGAYDWSDRFVQISIPLFLIAVAFSFGVHQPNLKRMEELGNELAAMGPPPAGSAGGPPPQAVEMERRGKAAARNGGILHVMFAVLLVLMVWRPL
ncbi:MAG: putative integral rane protein [Actinomycetota bacterium]